MRSHKNWHVLLANKNYVDQHHSIDLVAVAVAGDSMMNDMYLMLKAIRNKAIKINLHEGKQQENKN